MPGWGRVQTEVDHSWQFPNLTEASQQTPEELPLPSESQSAAADPAVTTPVPSERGSEFDGEWQTPEGVESSFPWWPVPAHDDISRDGVLDDLMSMSYVQACPGEGKAKSLYLPVLTPKVDLGLICKFQERDCEGTFPEVYNIAALSKYLHDHLNRRENAEILAEAWNSKQS